MAKGEIVAAGKALVDDRTEVPPGRAAAHHPTRIETRHGVLPPPIGRVATGVHSGRAEEARAFVAGDIDVEGDIFTLGAAPSNGQSAEL